MWLGARRKFPGQILGAYFILYGVERGIIEFFRGDPGRTMMFHDAISLMQIVSAALVLAGVILWIRGQRSPWRSSCRYRQLPPRRFLHARQNSIRLEVPEIRESHLS